MFSVLFYLIEHVFMKSLAGFVYKPNQRLNSNFCSAMQDIN